MIWPNPTVSMAPYILTSLLKLGRSLHNFHHNCSIRLQLRHHVLSVKLVEDLELKTSSKIVFPPSLKIHHLASFTLDSFKYTRQFKKIQQIFKQSYKEDSTIPVFPHKTSRIKQHTIINPLPSPIYLDEHFQTCEYLCDYHSNKAEMQVQHQGSGHRVLKHRYAQYVSAFIQPGLKAQHIISNY